MDILSTLTKQYNLRNHPSTKLAPIQASFEKHEGYVNHKFLDKRNNLKAKYEIGDLVKTADLRRYDKLVLQII